ncbi:hypothetical protein [Candidatus Binatus sp.]|uniref:hypothetical protein n=1 Tax=Candidatus Binatus sp. TaxID=2811406 RepID=UPI003BB026BA
MNLREAREEIESTDFAARVNVASGLSTLLAASKLEGAVVALWNEMISEEVTLRVLNRIRELAEESVDSRYRNPRDTALAVYLWLLALRSPGLCDVGAETTLKAGQCFWSKHLARRHLLEGVTAAWNSSSCSLPALGDKPQDTPTFVDANINTGIIFQGIDAMMSCRVPIQFPTVDVDALLAQRHSNAGSSASVAEPLAMDEGND